MWSYGYTATLGSAFNIWTCSNFKAPGVPWPPRPTDAALTALAKWSLISADPGIFFNPTAAVLYSASGGLSVQPGQVFLHPGPQGQYSVARWTAPSAGSFNVSVTFQGIAGYNSTPVTTTDVHVQHNVVDVGSGYINLNGSGNSFVASPTVHVAAGDTIDFAVGYGDGNYDSDSTAVAAVLCKQDD